MSANIGRRAFLTLLGGAGTATAARARSSKKTPVIGYLHSGAAQPPASSFAAFRQGLRAAGHVDVAIAMHGTDRPDRLPALAVELVRRRVDLIVATGSANAARAAKAATTTIPIVFADGSDAVTLGLVDSLNRPGGNATGVSFYSSTLAPKRLELLREMVGQPALIGFLTNPTILTSKLNTADVQAAAQRIGQGVVVLRAASAEQIEEAYAAAARRGIGALLVDGGGLFNRMRDRLAALAAHHGMPASYSSREYAVSGGLLSYGDDRLESYRQLGIYAGRILKGERPADLPVLQPAKFELVINLKTAMALGLAVPATLLARADEVIE